MTEKEILSELSEKKEICFGAMIGELGWEIILWSGFIKRYKKDNPDKKIYVATRYDRRDLYTDSVDDVITFTIPNDYNQISPRTNTLMLKASNIAEAPASMDTSTLSKNIINEVKQKYPNCYLFSFEKMKFSTTPVFDLKTLDYTFNPPSKNQEIIDSIISKNPNKPVITIFSRNRVDMSHRNWSPHHWKVFYELISKHELTIFVSGTKPSFERPNKKLKNFYVLEDYEELYNNTCSTLGLTIEAVRRSLCTFGIQSAGTLISNVMKVPNIYIGREVKLVSILHNPYETVYKNISPHLNKDYTYAIDSHTVYEQVKMFIEDLLQYKIEEEHPFSDVVETHIETVNSKLEGLSEIEKEDKLKEMNFNPNYRHQVITTIPKKVKIR